MLSPDYGLGSMALLAIDPGTVRKWYGKIGTATGPAMQGACYRLLRAILNTAAEDELIPYSPCKIKGAGRMKPKDRDILSTDQIGAIADAIYPRYRALVYLTAYTGLRRAEIVGLRRCDIDLNDKVVHVRQIMGWVDGQWLTGPPKSDAGKRSIDLPHFVADIMMEHLSKYVVEENDALVFTSVTGKPIHTGMLSRGLTSAGKKIGRPDVHMHLLRHTHLTMVRQAGATEKELMTRGGHSDIRAAMLYQHTTRERGRKLAYRLGEMALEMNTAIDLDSMTVPQLRQYARNVGLSSITRLDKKQELVVAIKRVQEKYPGRYV
jgi:integrase